MSIVAYPITFNGIDLNSITGLSVLGVNSYIPAKRDLNIANLARSNKGKANSAFYTERNIIVKIYITRNNRGLLEQSIDELMNIVQGIEGTLIVPQAGGSRSYTATLADTPVRDDGGMSIGMDLVFACSDRFGYDLAYTLLLAFSTYTSQTRSDGLAFGGSALWQAPLITITYTAVTGGTNSTVNIGNGNTGQQVAITRNWIAGDVIIIDCLAKTVKVNGTEVLFVGAIPEWNTGTGYWYYSDNFATSRTINGNIKLLKRYV